MPLLLRSREAALEDVLETVCEVFRIGEFIMTGALELPGAW